MLLVIVTIVVLVTIHELGHYLTALCLGVGVQEFCVGFGPKLFATRIGETRFTLRLLPLGGYVDPVDWDDVEYMQDDMEPIERRLVRNRKRWLSSQPLWERLAIVIMGPAVNAGLCVLLLSFVGLASEGQGWRDVVAATIHAESRESVLGISISHDNILSDIGTSFQLGLVPYLRHLAIVSLWLGGFNMLPIPPLDGSGLLREMFLAGYVDGLKGRELKRRRKLVQRFWGYLAFVGLLYLLFFAG